MTPVPSGSSSWTAKARKRSVPSDNDLAAWRRLCVVNDFEGKKFPAFVSVHAHFLDLTDELSEAVSHIGVDGLGT